MGVPAPLGVAASGKPPAGDQASAVLSGTITAVGPTAPFAFRGPMNLAIWGSFNTALTTTAGSLAATVASGGAIAAGEAINSANVPKGTTVATIAGTNITAMKVPPISLPGTISTNEAAIKNVPDTTGLVGATVSGAGIPSGTTVLAIIQAAVGGQGGIVELSNVPTATTASPSVPDVFTYQRNGNAITTTGADASATFTGADIVHGSTVQLERSFDGGATWLPCNLGSSGLLASWGTPYTPISITFGEPERNVLYRLNCTAFGDVSGVTLNYRISQTGAAVESLAIGQLT